MTPPRPILVGIILLAILAVPPAAAQQPAKVARIGWLGLLPPEHPQQRESFDVYRQAFRELGYEEGRNLVIEYRWSEGKVEQLAALASDLVRLNVDVIVAPSTPHALAAKRATSTIPIVASAMHDPVKDGLVASLARPGGNVTGTTFLGPELVPKRLGLLKEAIPGISRVAALWHPGVHGERTMQDMLNEAEAAARGLGLHLPLVKAQSPGDLDGAFSAMSRGRADAVIRLPSPMFFAERRRIVTLAAKHRLPTMYNAREFVDLGGLMAYGASLPDLQRKAAVYIDKTLKGAKPADLPVQEPTSYELAINLKSAAALGLTVPQSVLGRADVIIK